MPLIASVEVNKNGIIDLKEILYKLQMLKRLDMFIKYNFTNVKYRIIRDDTETHIKYKAINNE